MSPLAFLGKVFVTNVIDAFLSAKVKNVAGSLVPHLLVYLIFTNCSAMIFCGIFDDEGDFSACVTEVQESNTEFLSDFNFLE